jgi:Xaa-Pro aminopeptidase
MSETAAFRRNREALMRRLPDGLILLSGGRETPRNHDVSYPFRQKSDFLYLTGVEEPGCHLLLDPKRKQSTLFIPRIDNHHRVWEGHVPGPAESRKLFGISRVDYSDQLRGTLKAARRGYRNLYTYKDTAAALREESRGLSPRPAALADALEELRAVKTEEELGFMAFANRVSGAAHKAVMRATRPGLREYEVQAIFDAECLKAGLKHLAYPSIVAAGANGAVLHYRKNDALLKDGDLLLIDAGAEHKGYAADITRTFPVGKRFTQRQKDVYNVVLKAQKTCIDGARAGVISGDLHILSMTTIAAGLKDLGLLKGDVSGLVEGGAVRLFYPHGLTHMLGLDVHDVTGGKRRQLPNTGKITIRFMAKLEPGFVITIEPGVYFIEALLRDPELRRKHRGSVDFARAEKFLDFGGIRIEDDVVISPSGPPRDLTSVPKEIAEIEELRRAAR